MMAADRSILSRSAIFLLLVLLGAPVAARCATLEDSAKELALKIAAELQAREAVTCELRNNSSLRPEEVARIEQTLRAELQRRDISLAGDGAATTVSVTLSENWKELVWTAEIRHPDASQTVLLAVSRAGRSQFVSNAMHVMVRGEKFWEGQEAILDAAEESNGSSKSWLVLLLPTRLMIQDFQSGSVVNLDIVPAPATSRDPRGQLGFGIGQPGSVIWFATGALVCKVDLGTRVSPECSSKEEFDKPSSARFPMMMDLAPVGPPPAGKGIELVIAPVCGGTNQFLATSARDDTQTDSLQVFQTESNGPVAMSGELDFPGPIVALHTALDAPRAVVRNLTTGNYEAYRLSISCGE